MLYSQEGNVLFELIGAKLRSRERTTQKTKTDGIDIGHIRNDEGAILLAMTSLLGFLRAMCSIGWSQFQNFEYIYRERVFS